MKLAKIRRKYIGASICLLAVTFSTSAKADQASCKKQGTDEALLYNSDFHWGYGLEEMGKKFEEIYESGKRLKNRAYYDATSKQYFFDIPGFSSNTNKKAKISPRFLASITKHVETALKRKTVDYIFFPDMGHSHYYIPNADYGKLDKIPNEDKNIFLEKIFALPSLKILYHTAEQLKNMEDKEGPLIPNNRLLWRYFTRNLVGKNLGTEEIEIYYAWENKSYNTLGEDALEGYRYYGGGFNISASKNGCFPYQWNGKTYYFDLSLEDLPSDPNTSATDQGESF